MSLLDQFRDAPRFGRPPAASTSPAPGMALSSRIRRTLWVALWASAGLAAVHPFARIALAQLTGGTDPIAAGLALLSWPDAAAQPILLGAVAAVLVGGAVATRGFTVTSSPSRRAMTGAMIVGAVAALPLILVLTAAVVAGAVMLALCIAIGALLGWILISAVSR